MIWLLLLLPQPVTVDVVDIAEINHVFQPSGGHLQGSYWVWYRWQEIDGRFDYHVADWRRLCEAPRPVNGVQEFYDSKAKLNRRVESKVFREVDSWYDRESEDRKLLPESKRRKLSVNQRGQANTPSQGTP